jgi:hypothetical protein
MDEYKCLKKTSSGKDFIQCRRWFVNKNNQYGLSKTEGYREILLSREI